MKVALDTMVFIYLFDAHSDYETPIKLLFNRIDTGKLQAVTSYIAPLEVFSTPTFEENADKLVMYTQFFQKTPHLTLIPLDWEIVLQAAKLRRLHKSLKTPDAIQLATGIIHQADAFITNDKKILSLTSFPLKIVPLAKYA